MEIIILSLIFLAGLIAGLYGALTGSGGLFRIASMMFAGLPPQVAIATNKIGAIGTTISSTYNFAKQKVINYKIGFFSLIFLVVGTVIGTKLVIGINVDILEKIVAITMMIMVLITLLKKDIGLKKRKTKINIKEWIISSILIFFVGIYAGFIGGGFGTLLGYVMLFIFGQTFIESAATTKIPSLVSHIVALFIFWKAGYVNVIYGLILFTGGFIGGFISSHYAEKIGNVWIKRGFVIVVFIMAIKILVG